MIRETATVVVVEQDALWVETIQQSTCGTCAAQKGCGQGVLAKYLSKSAYFRIQIESDEQGHYQVGDQVELGIDEAALVRASLWLYTVPLLGFILGAGLGSLHSEIFSILGALLGLGAGGLLSALHARRVKNDPKYAPALVLDSNSIRLLEMPDPGE